jgi:hypothetical protein
MDKLALSIEVLAMELMLKGLKSRAFEQRSSYLAVAHSRFFLDDFFITHISAFLDRF